MKVATENQFNCTHCGAEGKTLYSRLEDRLFNVEGLWNLLQCPACNLVWLHPRPKSEEIHKLYSEYHTHESPRGKEHSGRFRTIVRSSILNSFFDYSVEQNASDILGSLLSKVPILPDIVGSQIMMLDAKKRGKLLDIGSGNGVFLKRMLDLGWNVTGVEPDVSAARITQDTFGIPVHVQTLERAELDDKSFDVITMDHVIEHMSDPRDTLKIIYSLLRDDGYLAILTPNFDSFLHSVYRRSWLHLDPPRHTYLYSRESLKNAVEASGFRVECLRTLSSSAWWVWISSYVIATQGKIKDGKLSKKHLNVIMKIMGVLFETLEELLRAGLIPGWSNSGEEIYLLARKK